MARINLSIRLGPMVHFEVQGESCQEIAKALDGFERLNQTVDAMFSDLARRVYPEGEEVGEAKKTS
ncbi:MAG: hypothetical protein ACREFV_02105 [Acetobacteraceae bacterium]